jgi:DNA-binding LacI/PurR family transcriptional regulator
VVTPKLRKTTIVDIAAASGVSVATVSRILNDRPDVADETRERVLRVMDEIGFAPQSAWRQIRSGRTGLIAMHVPQEFNPPAHRLIMAAALGVEDAGYSINIITRTLTDGDLLGIFRSRQADGILLLEILTDDRRAELLRDHGFPFVMIGHRADNTGMSYVDVDIEHGIDIAIEHLVGSGHRRIGFLTLDPVVEDKTYGFATWALQAYEQACDRLGLAVLARVGGPTTDDLSMVAQGLIDGDVTALVALQEQSVIGALRAVQARGNAAANHHQLPRRRDGQCRRADAPFTHRARQGGGRTGARPARAHRPREYGEPARHSTSRPRSGRHGPLT